MKHIKIKQRFVLSSEVIRLLKPLGHQALEPVHGGGAKPRDDGGRTQTYNTQCINGDF